VVCALFTSPLQPRPALKFESLRSGVMLVILESERVCVCSQKGNGRKR